MNNCVRVSILGALSLSSLIAQAVNLPWELAHPNAQVLLGVNVKEIRESALGKSLSEQMSAQMMQSMAMLQAMQSGSPQGKALMMKANKLPIAELLSDIDSVFLSSPADVANAVNASSSAKARSGSPGGKQSSVLIVVKGTFPEDHIRPLLEGKHPSYKGIDVYSGTGSNDASMALLDEHTILIGDAASVHGAIDRRGTRPVATQVMQRAQLLAAGSDFWMIARNPAPPPAVGARPSPNPGTDLTGAEFAMQMREGLAIDAALEMRTEASAKTFSDFMNTEIRMASAGRSSDPQAAELLRKIQIASQGNRMTVHVAFTAEELKRSIELAQASRSGFGLTAGNRTAQEPSASRQPAVQLPPAPPAPSGPRVVRIYGLDDGVREVKLDAPEH